MPAEPGYPDPVAGHVTDMPLRSESLRLGTNQIKSKSKSKSNIKSKKNGGRRVRHNILDFLMLANGGLRCAAPTPHVAILISFFFTPPFQTPARVNPAFFFQDFHSRLALIC